MKTKAEEWADLQAKIKSGGLLTDGVFSFLRHTSGITVATPPKILPFNGCSSYCINGFGDFHLSISHLRSQIDYYKRAKIAIPKIYQDIEKSGITEEELLSWYWCCVRTQVVMSPHVFFMMAPVRPKAIQYLKELGAITIASFINPNYTGTRTKSNENTELMYLHLGKASPKIYGLLSEWPVKEASTLKVHA